MGWTQVVVFLVLAGLSHAFMLIFSNLPPGLADLGWPHLALLLPISCGLPCSSRLAQACSWRLSRCPRKPAENTRPLEVHPQLVHCYFHHILLSRASPTTAQGWGNKCHLLMGKASKSHARGINTVKERTAPIFAIYQK